MRAHYLGKAVHAWTINEPEEIEYLLDLGVDGIMTDNLSALKSVYLDRESGMAELRPFHYAFAVADLEVAQEISMSTR